MRLRLLPFMGRLLAVALLSSLSPLVLGPTTALAAGDQAVAYQNDPAHTGGQVGDALRPLLQKKWSVDLNAGTVSYPLIAGGLVYVVAENTIATTSTRLFALDQSTGRTVWSASPGGSWADAAFDNGNVFAMNDRGMMSSFNGQTGALNWSMSLANSTTVLFDSPPTAANGIVYTAGSGYGGTVFALSEADGHVIWSRPVQEGQDSAPAVSTTGVYVSYPGEVYDFAPATGTLIWQYSHGYGGGGTTPVLFNDRLYYRDWFGNGAGIIFNAGTGAQLGTFTSVTPPVFDNSFAFFMSPGTSYGGTLEERNLSDNALRWSFAGDGALTAPPVAVNGYVYTGSTSGSLWALDENGGRVVWSDNLGSTIASGMAIGNSLLVVPAGSGVTVYMTSGTPPPPPPSPTPPPIPAGPSDVAFQVDSMHTGGQPSETMAPPLTRRWSRDLGGRVSYPLIAQGMAFVTSGNATAQSGGAKLWALSLQDGASVWGPVDLGGSWNSNRAGITYESGTLFALNYFGLLQAFDAGTGLLKWSRKLPVQFYTSSPPTARHGVVFVAAEENGSSVYAVSEANGAVLWRQDNSSGGSQSSPAVSDTGVYLSYSCQEILDYAPANGHLIWQHSTSCHGGGGSTPALNNNRLYVRDPAGNLVLDGATGNVLGTFTANPPPAFDGSRGFFLNNGTLEARDLTTNALLWTFAGDGSLDSAPLVVSGSVYVGSSSGAIFAVGEQSGTSAWNDNTGAAISAPNESTSDVPLTGLGAGEGTLLVPASTTLVAYGASAPPPPSSTSYWSATSTQQYRLSDSDGATFTSIDATKLKITLTPTASATALLTGNADLWTATSGYNQDLGIAANAGGTVDQLVAWKESGGYGGIFSPNATAVQATYQLAAGTPITFRLVWKTNTRQAPGASVYAGAGPLNGTFSPSSLSLRILPSGSVRDLRSTQQYRLGASDAVHWTHLDNGSSVRVTPVTASVARLGGNADLWTETAGVNQDFAILVIVDSGPEQLVAWKESGGAAGTYSPNAAFIQATYPVVPGHVYDFWLAWKTNRPFSGPGAIHAGAGPINGQYSPTSLIAQVLPAAVSNASSAKQYSLPGSNGSDWVPLDATSFEVSLPVGTTTASAVLGGNADLWTDTAGINQDLAIFVSVNGAPEQLVAWKESGGFAGTYSPNAAFVRADYRLEPGVTYTFTLQWKSNRLAPSSAGIHAGAGPLGTQYSPTSLIADIVS